MTKPTQLKSVKFLQDIILDQHLVKGLNSSDPNISNLQLNENTISFVSRKRFLMVPLSNVGLMERV
jgi:hypothetical protein